MFSRSGLNTGRCLASTAQRIIHRYSPGVTADSHHL